MRLARLASPGARLLGALAIALASLAAAPAPARAQLNLDPIPPSHLRGATRDTLEVKELNFAATAPNGWEWKGQSGDPSMKQARTYVCAPSEPGTMITMTVIEGHFTTMDAKTAAEMMAGFLESVKRTTPATTSLEGPIAHDLPRKGESWRWVARSEGANGEVFLHCVAMGRGEMYSFNAICRTREEPPELEQLLRSFRMLDPEKDAAYQAGRKVGFVAGFAGCMACPVVCALVIWMLFIKKKPPGAGGAPVSAPPVG